MLQLVKVSCHHIRAEVKFTSVLRHSSVENAEKRGLAAAVCAENKYSFALADMYVHISEQLLLAEGFSEIAAYKHIVSALELRLKAHTHCFQLAFGCDELRLDAVGFLLTGGGGDEVPLTSPAALLLNNALDTPDFLHVVFVFIFQSLVEGFFFADKFRVRALVAHDFSVLKLDRLVRDVVEEVTVVADNNHRALEISQEVLEPADSLDVEVVGRLVEEKQVAAREQELCEA